MARTTTAGFDRRPALPLLGTFGDARLAELLGRDAYVEAWIRVEQALAEAQADAGILTREDAAAVVRALDDAVIDLDALDAASLVVGYPILPLLEQLGGGPGPTGRYVHWGATTQDIMDTGLVLVLRGALGRIRELVVAAGDTIGGLAIEHRETLMAARTHAQPAVPTTLGAKFAVWLTEFGRHLDRLDSAEPRLSVVSLHGAGGTSAAMGPRAAEVREGVASRLGLAASEVPWHASRDVIAEVGFVVAAMAATAGRIAREIVDLSAARDRRGVGGGRPPPWRIVDHAAEGQPDLVGDGDRLQLPRDVGVDALLAAMRVEHERSAGEWQIEWDAVPSLIAAAGGSLLHLGEASPG